MGQITAKSVAEKASEAHRNFGVVSKDAEAFLTKASKDAAFAERLVDLAKQGNKAAFEEAVKQTIKPKSTLTVEELDSDWCFRLHFKFLFWEVSLEFGTTCR